jgi:carboxymethylenebutenolidase
MVGFDGPGGKINGYLVRLKEKGKRPAVVLIHENRGLNPHIKDVARRFALEGFLAYAVDFLSTSGGTPENEDTGRDMIGKLDLNQTEQQAVAAVAFLEKHPEANGKAGAVGFCWGGALINRLAVASPDLDAAVAYYGRSPDLAKVPNIKAPLLEHYAEKDDGVNSGRAAFEAALKENNKKFTMYSYPGTQHAFNNDTGGPRYNKEQADIAWGRTVAFLKENLKA